MSCLRHSLFLIRSTDLQVLCITDYAQTFKSIHDIQRRKSPHVIYKDLSWLEVFFLDKNNIHNPIKHA